MTDLLERRGNEPQVTIGPVKNGTMYNSMEELPILVISGPFCAGKTDLKNELHAQMTGNGIPVRTVLNYKLRDPKAYELPGVDYLLVESPEEFDRFEKQGKIVASYIRDDHKYGLSQKFLGALQLGSIPIMEMQIHGFGNLMQYVGEENITNRVVSFLLHTTYSDAKARLFSRAGKELTPQDIEFIQSHIRTLEDEYINYRIHEDSFRHVIRNPTVETRTKYESIDHLARRVRQIIDLEGKLDATGPADFREAYVDIVVSNVLGMHAYELPANLRRPIKLDVSPEIVKMYSTGQKVEESAVRAALKNRIIGYSNHYGMLTLYFEEITDEQQKKILMDMIQILSQMEYQNKFGNIVQAKTSRFGLTGVDPRQKDGFVDSFISFSSYDPMRTPKPDARTHTVAFESLHDLREPRIEAISPERAMKVIEGGNGHA